jgi:hypothetical protein
MSLYRLRPPGWAGRGLVGDLADREPPRCRGRSHNRASTPRSLMHGGTEHRAQRSPHAEPATWRGSVIEPSAPDSVTCVCWRRAGASRRPGIPPGSPPGATPGWKRDRRLGRTKQANHAHPPRRQQRTDRDPGAEIWADGPHRLGRDAACLDNDPRDVLRPFTVGCPSDEQTGWLGGWCRRCLRASGEHEHRVRNSQDLWIGFVR